eukprot:scaffold26040_cov117-Isochrysis_galbana.AAC.1
MRAGRTFRGSDARRCVRARSAVAESAVGRRSTKGGLGKGRVAERVAGSAPEPSCTSTQLWLLRKAPPCPDASLPPSQHRRTFGLA